MNVKNDAILNDESGGLLAAEPVGAVAMTHVAIKRHVDPLADGVPHTVEAALAAIEEGEREFERGKTFSHRAVMQMIWDKINAYAG